MKETIIRDFLFADDCAFNASSQQVMQSSRDRFSSACDNFWLTISTKKTEVMHQPAPRKTYQKPSITVKGETLEAVDNFTQLGCTLFGAVNTDVEVNGRLMKTSSAFQRYHKNVWVRSRIGFSTKLNLYHPYCSPRSCKPLRPRQNSRYARQLNHFYIICPHKFLKIR